MIDNVLYGFTRNEIMNMCYTFSTNYDNFYPLSYLEGAPIIHAPAICPYISADKFIMSGACRRDNLSRDAIIMAISRNKKTNFLKITKTQIIDTNCKFGAYSGICYHGDNIYSVVWYQESESQYNVQTGLKYQKFDVRTFF